MKTPSARLRNAGSPFLSASNRRLRQRVIGCTIQRKSRNSCKRSLIVCTLRDCKAIVSIRWGTRGCCCRRCAWPGGRFRLTQSSKYPKRFLLRKKVRPANSNFNLHSPTPHEETAKELRARVCPSNCSRSRSDIDLGDLLASTLRPPVAGPQPDRPAPDVVAMVGPVSQDVDLRALRYVPSTSEEDEFLSAAILSPWPEASIPEVAIHGAVNAACAGANSQHAFSNTDVRRDELNAERVPLPSARFRWRRGTEPLRHSVNSSIKIFDKLGNPLNGTNGTTYNSFFSALGAGNPCGNNQNDGDGIVFYDHMADRWVVSDFAFRAFPGTAFLQCIGVSKTSDPVSGGWWLYAMQVDPANPSCLGDYPKFGLWPDAYYLSMNEFSSPTTFNGVRVYALNRNSMVNGGSANAIGFSILPPTSAINTAWFQPASGPAIRRQRVSRSGSWT